MTAGSCRPYEAGPSGYELYWLLVSMGLRAAREVEAREAELRAAEAWLSARAGREPLVVAWPDGPYRCSHEKTSLRIVLTQD